MTASKRTPVPSVAKPKPKKDPITDPITDTSETATTEENNMTDAAPTFVKRTLTLIRNNKPTIKRKLVVGLGSGLGMIIASAVIETLNKPTTEVLYVEVPVQASDVPTDAPSEA